MAEQKQELVSVDNLTGSSLVNVSEWENKIQEAKDNFPVIEIIDNATYEAQKKSRTAIKTVRVEIEKQDKVIASAFTKIRKETMEIRDRLLGDITPFEELHQAEVDKWEQKKENERLEKERIENERIAGIKKKIDDFETKAMSFIQKMTFEESKHDLTDVVTSSEDFEEYDVLYQQAAQRVQESLKQKITDLSDKEDARIENERLEAENKAAREIIAIQNERLAKIAQYIPFTDGLNVIELHAYTQEEFDSVYETAKDRKEESGRAESERQRDEELAWKEKERLEREEKEAVYNIRKDRLTEMGFVFDDVLYHFRLYHNSSLDKTSISKNDVFTMNTISFEKFISETKEEKEMQIQGEKQRKEAELKAEKENKARQKALATDKQRFSDFIDTLEFQGTVPDSKNELFENYHSLLFDKLDQFKAQLLTDLKNF